MVGNILKVLLFSVSALFLSGCSTLYNPATGRNEIIFINTQTEVAIGRSAVSELTKKHKVSGNISLQERARNMGRRLADVCDRRDIEYRFSVLEDKELNAMTLPGGFIYVNEGLMKALNDDELAYVLGHEIGHVAARHIAKKLQANMSYQMLLGLAFAGLGAKGATEGAQGVAKGVDMLYGLLDLKFSRQDEYEADRLGVKYSYKAGFSPYFAISALEKIKEKGTDPKIFRYFRTHPYAEDRIKALKQVIPQMSAK